MKSRLNKSVFAVIILFVFQSAGAINIRYINGTYAILKPEYRQISPAHGPVWWEKNIVRHIYFYGLAGNDPGYRSKGGVKYPGLPYGTVQLTRLLFHVVQGSFNLTTALGSPANYFTPKTVGLLIGTMENARHQVKDIISSQMRESKKVIALDELQNRLIGNLTKALGQDDGYNSGVSGYYTSIAGSKDFKKKHDYFLRDQEQLVNAIVASLEESGFFELPSARGRNRSSVYYPPFSTYNILEAFLYRKASEFRQGAIVDKADYKAYFQGVQEVLHDDIFTPQGRELFESAKWLRLAYADSGEALAQMVARIQKIDFSVDTLSKYYEQIVFTELSIPEGLPHFAAYRRSQFLGRTLTDCIETALRNLFDVALFSKKTNRFEIEDFKSGTPSPGCKAFYTHPFYRKASEVENEFAHNTWNQISQARPYVVYRRIVKRSNGVEYGRRDFLRPGKEIRLDGFIIGTKEMMGKVNAGIETIFDGEKLRFPLIELDGHHIALIDPRKFAPFEIEPTLKNTIVLMNDLLGLELYPKDQPAPIFEANFNDTYFPLLAKKLNWKYEDTPLNTGDVDIRITSDGGTFILSLLATDAIGLGHGEVLPVSVSPIEPYQQRLSTSLQTLVTRLSIDGVLEQNAFAVNLLALHLDKYDKSISLNFNLEDSLRPLFNFVNFTQRLAERNIKSEVIKAILEGGHIEMFDVAAELIKSLPVNGSYFYVKQLQRLDLKLALENKSQNRKIKAALLVAYNKMLTRPVNKDAIEVAKAFVQRGLFLEEGLKVVKKAMDKFDALDAPEKEKGEHEINVKLIVAAMELLETLVDRGIGKVEAKRAADNSQNNRDPYIQKAGTHLAERLRSNASE
jgi:hypothetical protein